MSLKERREIVAMCREAAGRAAGVLISLVDVAGSSYRRPGARLLALDGGGTAGTLSGGCLEADLLRRAVWTVRAGAVLEHFSTAFDDTAEIPYGLGCGGEVDVLLEPLQSPEAAALVDALEATLTGEHRTVATLLPASGRPMERIVLDAGGDVLFASESMATEEVVGLRSAARAQGNSGVVPVGTQRAFVEHLPPAQRLVLFGAGEDARPLARMAAETMGWTVVVVDTRARRSQPARFPGAHSIVVGGAAAGVPVRPEDAVVVMTHSYEQDRNLIAEMLPLAPRYLGLLGARHRSALLLKEASEAAGVRFSDAIERTHAPIGLLLGGDGPEAVSLAIVAELQTALYGSGGSPVAARRLTLDAAERLLLEKPTIPMDSACVLYAEPAEVYP